MKSRFREIMRNHCSLEEIESFLARVQRIDDEFRTAEAHGTGRLRNWVLSDALFSSPDSPALVLMDFHNDAKATAEALSSKMTCTSEEEAATPLGLRY